MVVEFGLPFLADVGAEVGGEASDRQAQECVRQVVEAGTDLLAHQIPDDHEGEAAKEAERRDEQAPAGRCGRPRR
jgi:hypothetical protein